MYQRIYDTRARHLDTDRSLRRAVTTRDEVYRTDIEFQIAAHGLGDHIGQTRRILRHDGYRHAECAVGVAAPPRLHHTVGITLAQALRVGTVRAVYRDARSYGHESEYRIALDRVAALGQFVLYVSYTLVDHKRVARTRRRLLRLALLDLGLALLDLRRHGAPLLVGTARDPACQDILYGLKVELLRADHRLHLAARTHLELTPQIGHGLVDRDTDLPVLELALQLLTPHARILHLLLTQVGLDARARLRRDADIEPVGLRRLVLLRQDLDYIAVMQHVAYRCGAVVHLGARTCTPQTGMYVECEIQHRRPLGQLAYVAVGREDEDLARGGLGLETLRQRVRRLLQHLTQTAQPCLARLPALIDTLVAPVCRDTALGHGIHTLRADLDLDPAAASGRHGRMQGLVTVRLGDGDPVAHTLGVGRIAVAHDRVDRPA